MAQAITYDREKVKELRMKVLFASLEVMDGGSVDKWSEYKRQLVLKYAPYILPRLNGGLDDDTPLIPKPLLGGKSNGSTSNKSNDTTS